VFSTSQTAVAFGISGGLVMAKSPLRFARPSGEAAVIEDDGKCAEYMQFRPRCPMSRT